MNWKKDVLMVLGAFVLGVVVLSFGFNYSAWALNRELVSNWFEIVVLSSLSISIIGWFIIQLGYMLIKIKNLSNR